MWFAAKYMRIWRLYSLVVAVFLFCGKAFAGYTHYYTWHERPNSAALASCISEMRLIVEAQTNILAGPEGSGAPEISSTNLVLNGIGDDGHEPFVFPKDLGFNFCKTAAKPYDAVVTACLLVARDHFPSSVLSIDSDGSWAGGDWQSGIDLYSKVLRRHPQNPMSPLWRVIGWRDSLPAYAIELGAVVFIGWFLWKRWRRWRGF